GQHDPRRAAQAGRKDHQGEQGGRRNTARPTARTQVHRRQTARRTVAGEEEIRSERMSNKELVMETIRQMPDDLSLEKISEEIAILAGIRRGEKAAEEGRLVPHDELKRRVGSWTSQ